MVPVGTDPSILTSKQVDGYIGYGTQQGLSLQQSGADVNIIYFTDLGNPDYGNAIFAKSDAVSAKKDVLTRFLKADLAGWKYFTEHPEEVAQYTWDSYHKETGAVLADEKVSGKAAVPLITAGDAKEHGLMWIEESKFQTVYDLYKLSGTITKDVDISSIHDPGDPHRLPGTRPNRDGGRDDRTHGCGWPGRDPRGRRAVGELRLRHRLQAHPGDRRPVAVPPGGKDRRAGRALRLREVDAAPARRRARRAHRG